MGHKYKISIEFETAEKLSDEIMADIAAQCEVQLESLEDGDLESLEEIGGIAVLKSASDIKSIG